MNAVQLRDEKIKELHNLINKMDLPAYRKSGGTTENFRWLVRNIGIRNSKNPNTEKALNILKELL